MTRPPLIRQGEGQAAAIIRHHHERTTARAEFEKIINRLIDQPDEKPTPKAAKRVGYRSGEGDHKRLRAIPVIAPSVGGTIPGTNPPAALLEKERRTA